MTDWTTCHDCQDYDSGLTDDPCLTHPVDPADIAETIREARADAALRERP